MGLLVAAVLVALNRFSRDRRGVRRSCDGRRGDRAGRADGGTSRELRCGVVLDVGALPGPISDSREALRGVMLPVAELPELATSSRDPLRGVVLPEALLNDPSEVRDVRRGEAAMLNDVPRLARDARGPAA